ncbi:MAG: c-type cytochrome [Isosphaeraceae bacterium]
MRRSRPILCLLIVGLWMAGSRRAWGEHAPTPEESLAALRLADPALKIELAASEPEIRSPVAVAWDELGGLFVAEMSDYPTASTGGRIKRLEDRDGDGRYEHATVFADGLPYPSGVLPWNGGVLVTAAPDLLFLKDSDGDGRADVRKVILTGFAEGNQQLRVNSPTWGRDNWVYLANGRSGGAVRRPDDPPAQAVAIPRNDLRVRLATGEFERIAGFSQFGLPRDDWGDRFPSWNTVPLRHVVLEDSARARASHSLDTRTVAEILDLSDGGRIYSLATAQRRFNTETVAYFNASCGPTIDRGDLLGAAYLGHAFVCEPLTSVVHHRRLDPEGPTFVARRVETETRREFLASTHPWFRPVNLANGPDGALYVVDFCRAWVEHPAFVPEAQRNAVDFREGHERGRLWRISPRHSAETPKPCRPGEAASPAALVAHLEHPNGWCRDTAQRLLVERRDAAANGPLRELVRASRRPLARAHALWTLDGLGALDLDTLRLALRDADPKVREQAVRLAEPRARGCLKELAPLVNDPEIRVRLRTAAALSGLDDAEARDAEARIADRDADSPWITSAILGGLADRLPPFVDALAARQPSWMGDPTPAQARFLGSLARQIGARDDEAEIASLLDRIAGAPGEPAAFALLHGLNAGKARRSKGPARDRVQRVRQAALLSARSDDRPAWVRVLALDVVLDDPGQDAIPLIPSLLDPARPVELQTAAARGVARVADSSLADTLLERWDRYALGTRRVLLGSLAGSVALAGRLVEAIDRGTVAASEIDPATRESLRRLTNPGLQARVDAVFRTSPNSDRGDVLRRYEPALALKANATKGRELFARQCQTCHSVNGRGAKVGPDLISVAGRPSSDLLVAILDPSREVSPDGVSVVVVTTQGQTLTGLLAEETPGSVRLRRAEGLEDVVPRAEIESLRSTGRSLMPDGLEQLLDVQDVADLIAFLHSPEPIP